MSFSAEARSIVNTCNPSFEHNEIAGFVSLSHGVYYNLQPNIDRRVILSIQRLHL